VRTRPAAGRVTALAGVHAGPGLGGSRTYRDGVLAGLPLLWGDRRQPGRTGEQRVALGAYVAFFDLSLGLASPIAGWLAGNSGYASIYAMGAAAALTAMFLALSKRKPATVTKDTCTIS